MSNFLRNYLFYRQGFSVEPGLALGSELSLPLPHRVWDLKTCTTISVAVLVGGFSGGLVCVFCLHVCLCSTCVPGAEAAIRVLLMILTWVFPATWVLGAEPGASACALDH